MSRFISDSATSSSVKPPRSRAWCFTLNNYTELQRACLLDFPFATYTIVGQEIAPTSLTPHLQGYVYMPTMKSLKQMQAVCQCHWTIAKGSAQQNQTYCSKEGRFEEKGTIPLSQNEKGAKGAAKIKEMWTLAKEGKLLELPPGQVKTWEYIHMRYGTKVEDRPVLDNLWIVGPTGCGKSRRVRDTYQVFYSKPMSKWWDGYAGEAVVLLDDFAPEHGKYLGYYLKIWADHYAFNGEVKGGMLRIRPTTILVTSQYTLAQCFEERETVSALTRRFTMEIMGPRIPDVLRSPLFHPGPQGCHVSLLRQDPPSLHCPQNDSIPPAPALQRTISVRSATSPITQRVHGSVRNSATSTGPTRLLAAHGYGGLQAHGGGGVGHETFTQSAQDSEEEEEGLPFFRRCRQLSTPSSPSEPGEASLVDTPPCSQV